MCVNAKKFSSKLNEIVAPHELPLFILDEIGEQIYVQSVLHAQRHAGGSNTIRNLVVLDHDLSHSVTNG